MMGFQKKNFMEDFEGPEKGGPEDRSSTEKVPVWTDVISKAELRNFRGKGFGKGGKGPGKEGKGGSIWKVLPQGEKKSSMETDFFTRYDIHDKPVVVVNAQHEPLPTHAITDPDTLHEVRRAQHDAFATLIRILREDHGPLDKAKKPVTGKKISLQIRMTKYHDLFKEEDWHYVIANLLGSDFIGFAAGSHAEVYSIPGQSPKITLTCLAFKSQSTMRLQNNPIVAGKFTLPKSNKEYTCDVAAYEMSLSTPIEAISVTGLQMICPYIPDKKDFSDMTRRYKEAIAHFLRCGIWKNLSTDAMRARFAVKSMPRSLKEIDG